MQVGIADPGSFGRYPVSDRGDVHNVAVDEVLAALGMCGQTDLRTGRICVGAVRHRGSCEFTPRSPVYHDLEREVVLFGARKVGV
jgi:hypothetical protein